MSIIEKAQRDLLLAIKAGALGQVADLLSQHPELSNTPDDDGRTPLHHAVLARQEPILSHLLCHGAIATAADDSNWTALHIASSIGDVPSATTLLATFAELEAHSSRVKGDCKCIDAKTSGGQTALHYAVSKGHVKVVVLLLEAGANMMTEDRQGQLPLHRAASLGFTNIVDLLLQFSSSEPMTFLRALLDSRDIQGNTPLHLAVEDQHLETAKLLEKYGADLTIKNKEGLTPIELAQTPEMQALFTLDLE